MAKVVYGDFYLHILGCKYARNENVTWAKGGDVENAIRQAMYLKTPLKVLVDIANYPGFDNLRDFLLVNPNVPEELRIQWALEWKTYR